MKSAESDISEEHSQSSILCEYGPFETNYDTEIDEESMQVCAP